VCCSGTCHVDGGGASGFTACSMQPP
jgi:hypothetical protein